MLADVLTEAQKDLEKSIITLIVASASLIKTESIKQKTKTSTSIIADNTQKSTERVAYNLESSIKGQWADGVQKMLEENNHSMRNF